MIRQENLEHKSRNVIGFEMSPPLYRVYSSSNWLIQAVKDQAITLVKPDAWDDPFENVVFRQTATMEDGTKIGLSEIEKLFYGLCWTLNPRETDALWRIYSPNKDGVRVKVSAAKLFDYFFNPDNPYAALSYFIGKVEYWELDKIKEFFENPDNLGAFIIESTGQGNAMTLLIKRTEFDHEDEVRLIYRGNKERDNLGNSLFQFHVDPNDLFEELLFDPRMSDSKYNAYCDELKRLGFHRPVAKSTLYSLPKMNLRLNV